MNSERLDEIRKCAASFLKEDRDRLDPHNKFLIGLAQEIIPELLSHIEALQNELDSMQRSYTDVYNRMREEFEINKTLTQERESWGNEFSAVCMLKDDLAELNEILSNLRKERDTLKAELERVKDHRDRKKSESALWEKEYISAAKERDRLRAENACLRDGLATLRVAVNDQQPDPGAVMFIDRTIAKADEIRSAK